MLADCAMFASITQNFYWKKWQAARSHNVELGESQIRRHIRRHIFRLGSSAPDRHSRQS
jgi:hypothetical protein